MIKQWFYKTIQTWMPAEDIQLACRYSGEHFIWAALYPDGIYLEYDPMKIMTKLRKGLLPSWEKMMHDTKGNVPHPEFLKRVAKAVTDCKNPYYGIQREKLIAFCLLNHNGECILKLDIIPPQQLIFRRRQLMKMSGEKSTVYIIGWQGKQTGSLLYLYPDGTAEISSNINDVEMYDYEKAS